MILLLFNNSWWSSSLNLRLNFSILDFIQIIILLNLTKKIWTLLNLLFWLFKFIKREFIFRVIFMILRFLCLMLAKNILEIPILILSWRLVNILTLSIVTYNWIITLRLLIITDYWEWFFQLFLNDL